MKPFIDRRQFMFTAAALPLAARAQGRSGFPQRPVRIVDAFAAGGISDVLARLAASAGGSQLQQSVVVENRPGAGGGIAAASVLQGVADGHSLLLASTSHAYSAALIPGIGFDLASDFAPVCGIAASPLAIVVRADSPWRSFDDLVKAAKTADGLAYGSGGVGTLTHLIPELLARQLGLKLTHVSYRGTAPAVQDLLGGQVAFVADLAQTAAPQVAGGRLRALAVTSGEPIAQLDQVPTLAQAALPGFQAQGWYGLVAPAGVPAQALELLRGAFSAAVGAPAFQQQLRGLGSSPMPLAPAEFGQLIAAEKKRWGDLVRQLGIRPT